MSAAAAALALDGNDRLDADRSSSLGEADVEDDHHATFVENRLGRGEVDRVIAAQGALVGQIASPTRDRLGNADSLQWAMSLAPPTK